MLSFLIKGPEIETILIFFFLFLSIFIAVLQDYRINKLSEKLLSYFENYAYVKRNGKWQRINAKEIVPGDYIRVSAGYLIPADLRILKAEDALVDESIITGESEPIPKSPQINADITRIDADKKAQLNPDSQSIIPKNIALMGTTLIKGEIEGIVFATGKESYFGSVAKKTLEIEKETAYQKMMTDFAKNIGILSIFIAFIVILINLLKPNYPNFQELIIFAIVLTVAIVPEFLPTMTVLALSLAGNRLAKRGLIIKRLSAIEDLGAIEILCTDKTGTITTNQLKLGKIISENQDEFIKYFLADYYLTKEITPYEKAIMEKLEEKNPDLADEIKRLMFVFDDILLLDDRTIQQILREIDSKDLVLALKGASEECRNKILKNMSSRARQMILEDMEVMGPVRLKTTEEAQQKIVNVIRQLEEMGEIVIARGGEEEIFV